MSVDNESRSCLCNGNNNNINSEMTALNNNFMSNSMQMPEDMCPESHCEHKHEMLKKIKCYAFAIQELTLYLDTHPTDEKALCLHNKYCKEYRELTDKYQRMFGPLTSQCPCNKWRWIEEPWASFKLG